jgi:hypothetical protein
MLTINLKSGRSMSFNLKSFEREKALHDAWYSMHGDPVYANKKFRVITMAGAKFEVAVDDITSMDFQEAEYYKVSPEEVR